MSSTIPSPTSASSDVAATLKANSFGVPLPQVLDELRQPDAIEDVARRRGIDRYRRIMLTGLTSLGTKGISLITAVVVVPLTFTYLGPERYGLWMTITSFVLFLGFADLGIGNGLTARIASAHGSEDTQTIKQLVSCAFFFLLLVSILLLLAFSALSPLINWRSAYGLHSDLAAREAATATAVLLTCTLASMPLGVVLRVQLGFQQGFVADVWNACGGLLALVGIIVALRFKGGLGWLVLAAAGLPLLMTTINWITQFTCVRPELRPRLRLFDSRISRQLFALGGLFFVQQCFGLIYYLSDNIVIARTMGAEHVAQYALVQRIFSVGLISQYLVVPLWPAIGEALARGDLRWAALAARRATLTTFTISSICALFLMLVSRYVITRWTHVDPGPIDLLRWGFAIWVVLVGYIATMNALLNQERMMKLHLIIFGTASLISLALKIVFARHGSLAGVVWATDIGFGTLYVVPTLLLSLKYLTPRSVQV